jgi:type IV secretory pathway TrbD component
LSQPAERRVSSVFKAMNRPLTVLGAERRLFFVALISGGAIFSLLHSLLGGIGLFIVGVIIARIASLALLALLIGCASNERPPKPSPYHYGAAAGASNRAPASGTNSSHGS